MELLLRVLCFMLVISLKSKYGGAQTDWTHTSTAATTIEGTTNAHNSTSKRPPSNRNLCLKGDTSVNGRQSCKSRIIFQELFSDLPLGKWRIENKFAGDPDYEFVLYQNNATNLFVKDELLHIRPTLLEDKYGEGYVSNSKGIDLGLTCTGHYKSLECIQKPRAWQILPPVISAQISTIDHFYFKYGTVEIRAKFPKGDWVYPEISLVSRSDLYGPGYNSGRIRIAFAPGNRGWSHYLFGGCTLGYSDTARNYATKRIFSENSWTDDFHTYKIQWKPDSIIFSVDNQIYGTVFPPLDGFASEYVMLQIDPLTAERWQKGTILAPFDHEMYLTLGVGVGGQMFLDEYGIAKPWNVADPKAQLQFYRNRQEWFQTWNSDTELLVDYVKVSAI